MKHLTFLIMFFVLVFIKANAQQETASFHATMALIDAKELKKQHPNEIEILVTKGNEAAVYMTREVSHQLHNRVLVHGPGYIFQPSEKEAIEALQYNAKSSKNSTSTFTISEDQIVNEVLNVINTQNIENHIKELQDYGTRYHTTATATESAQDLKTKWETMATAYNRTDVSVRLVNHINTSMPSVVMTIQGSEFPDEFVIVGGHLDSTSSQGNNDAPGADDDASGIATITEAARALFEIDFQPKRTIEIMAYAAEEVGLVGSAEIAKDYRERNVNVLAVGQFDMTNYNGSANDIYFIEDNTDTELNNFFKQLIDYYNTSGDHQLTYGTSFCNYGCSDHASWHREGFKASFPFEASFSNYNPNIHTRNDTFSISGTAEHATKFAKLCSEFLIEVAKNNGTLSVQDFEKEGYYVYVKNNVLNYQIANNASEISTINLYDINGRTILSKKDPGATGSINVKSMSTGVYIVSLLLKNQRKLYKKIVIQ